MKTIEILVFYIVIFKKLLPQFGERQAVKARIKVHFTQVGIAQGIFIVPLTLVLFFGIGIDKRFKLLIKGNERVVVVGEKTA